MKTLPDQRTEQRIITQNGEVVMTVLGFFSYHTLRRKGGQQRPENVLLGRILALLLLSIKESIVALVLKANLPLGPNVFGTDHGELLSRCRRCIHWTLPCLSALVCMFLERCGKPSRRKKNTFLVMQFLSSLLALFWERMTGSQKLIIPMDEVSDCTSKMEHGRQKKG